MTKMTKACSFSNGAAFKVDSGTEKTTRFLHTFDIQGTDKEKCAETVDVLTKLVRELSGPAGGTDHELRCPLNKYISVAKDCAATAAVLNQGMSVFYNGGFRECTITMPTTALVAETTVAPGGTCHFAPLLCNVE